MSLLKRMNGAPQTHDDEPSAKTPVPVGPGPRQGQAVRKSAADYQTTDAPSASPMSPAARRAGTLVPPAVIRVPGVQRESHREIKVRLLDRIVADIDPKLDLTDQAGIRREIDDAFGRAVGAESVVLTRAERKRLLEEITDEVIGLGPLEPLLIDDSITEVMVNGPGRSTSNAKGALS